MWSRSERAERAAQPAAPAAPAAARPFISAARALSPPGQPAAAAPCLESCDAAVHNGPVPGGSGGDGLAPTDPASVGLDTAAPRPGISSSYLPPTCPSTPIGGTGGGRGFAGAGGDGGGGPSAGHRAGRPGGGVVCTFLCREATG